MAIRSRQTQALATVQPEPHCVSDCDDVLDRCAEHLKLTSPLLHSRHETRCAVRADGAARSRCRARNRLAFWPCFTNMCMRDIRACPSHSLVHANAALGGAYLLTPATLGTMLNPERVIFAISAGLLLICAVLLIAQIFDGGGYTDPCPRETCLGAP